MKNILQELLCYNKIVVQCHDNPDADALASAFGIYAYFKQQGKDVKIIYSGETDYMKSNLKIMVQQLHIPAEYVTDMETSELLICVDCQYGEGNITKFPAQKIAVFDHHQDMEHRVDYSEIRSHYGSCSTLIYRCLMENGYDFSKDLALSTALYYGLYMDTNAFSEMNHPYDFDMMEELVIDKKIFFEMKNTNFTFQELELAAMALIRHNYHPENRIAYIRSNPCDRNMLGVISDLLIQVEEVDTCIVYAEDRHGYRISVRSCGEEVTAEDLVVFLTDHMGNGGGHTNKAGGFIDKKRIKSGGYTSIENYIYMKTGEFINSYEFLDTTKNDLDLQEKFLVRKKPIAALAVNTADIVPEGTELSVRFLAGMLQVTADREIYLVINKKGYVHIMRKQELEKCYDMKKQSFHLEAEYVPKAMHMITNETYDIMALGQTYIPNENACYYAKVLTKNIRLKNVWDRENCRHGKKGDYLMVSMHNPKECFPVKKEWYDIGYELINDTVSSNN